VTARFLQLRWTRWLGAVVGIALLLAAMTPIRLAVLRAAGGFIVREDRPIHADVIVVSVDADGAGVLEASDLVHQGFAPTVAIFSDPPDAVDQEFLRRGIPYHDAAAEEAEDLQALGVASVVRIPREVQGTHDEISALESWYQSHTIRSLIFVSTTDHTRRTRRMLRRALGAHPIPFAVIGSKYSGFDPNRWWRSVDGVRTEVVESQKLLLDIVLHPFS
jgi:hypothetical protein